MEDHVCALFNDGKVIGFIGGVDNPLINHFAAGYQAGAQYIDPDMQVLIDYAGSFNDPTTAKTIAWYAQESNFFNILAMM